MIETINIGTESYEIWMEHGVLQKIDKWVKNFFSGEKILIITDDAVGAIYLGDVKERLKQSGYTTFSFVVQVGEQSKSLGTAEKIYQFLNDNTFDRGGLILSLGGGVVGDLSGFVASTYQRGISFAQIPTSLLAQVDASIGGKTAVNLPGIKNSVGTFYQPSGVLIDPVVLTTLKTEAISEGLAEVIKCGMIQDSSILDEMMDAASFSEIVQEIEKLIIKSIRVKKALVEEDVFDQGMRMKLNFGHTIGHGIEATLGYGNITHGEAVAIGMVKMNQFAIQKGWTPKDTQALLIKLLEKVHLPTDFPKIDLEKVFEAMRHDKKSKSHGVSVVTLDGIGQSRIRSISWEEIKKSLA
ncbi:MAG: 3-dehydroquinate synthase [Streptococcaceae bacterium]|jgi:3-dehydroquinate synthase|nr:3-dehydroquinate synthase [Streptococcaceae bacterium]